MDLFYPIQVLADLVTVGAFGMTKGSFVESAVNFFVYDTIKIGLLLIAVNYLMAVTRYYFPMERARDILTRKRWFGMNYLLAALLGIVTPFCSCSSIPLFIGFMGAGIPLGVTFSFLISSPLINESSLYLFPAMFGMKVTVLYNLFGLTVAILGGMLIQRLRMERFVLPELLGYRSRAQVIADMGGDRLSGKRLALYFWRDGMTITRTVFPYVLLGVGLGAVIHGFVPSSAVEKVLADSGVWSVPAAVLLGIPLYANSVGVLPVMESLVGKGVPLGTALSFMTAIVTLSLPEALILKKVMRWQLLAVFFAVTAAGIMVMGFAFNLIGEKL